MAVVSTPLGSELVLVMDAGDNKSISRRFDNIKSAAVDTDVHAVAMDIIGLQEKNSLAIQRRDTEELEDDGQ